MQATGAVCALRPSFVMPSMLARPAAVATARSLRHWRGPFDALASVCGRDAMGWSRPWLACGRPSLLGTPVQDPQQVPTALGADEQGTGVAGQEGDVPTPVGGGGCLGGRVVAAAATAALETGAGAGEREAHALAPASQPRAVCPDGGHATREAGRRLLPTRTLVRCVLHAVLQRMDRGRGAWRHHGLEKAWGVSQATTKRPGAQRLRRLAAWTPTHRSGAVAEMVGKRCRRRADCTPA